MRIAIRGFAYTSRGFRRSARVQRFEDRADISALALDEYLIERAPIHDAALQRDPLHMIEIEFLDESDPKSRFIRYATNPWITDQKVRIGV